MVVRRLILVAAALVRGAAPVLVVAALSEGRGGHACQKAERNQGEEEMLHMAEMGLSEP